ncbi:P-loop containing nucleoside triphosphate hydrolase protein [Jimgerdemannia flammicorona]|uniref:P-loop containing nucleoside triphosphate hydrolase protein n=1 Tax=Jimgerdemannia flammicorona TaxID=994334 RepID=A0A433QD60_9FUNG|nr:P-loop containing nucleoside triphosphate hydrolase protein [Jimgerdemannia flammicorona]
MQLAKGVREWCLGCPIPASHGMTDHALDVTYRSNEHPMLKSSPRYPRNIHVATECIDETRERYIKPGDITTPAKHLSSLSKSKYGHKDAILIEILKKLREAGAQADIELPTLVFCGNQSAGKSSLIEAIAGVPLPRSDGTCTRCPMEIRLMASDEPWRCQVSVRWEFDSDGQRLDKMEERPFGNPITNPNEVEITVRRAQKAVLNPKQDQQIYESYLFGTKSYINDAATNLLKFSKNIICIEIRGEDTLNLSLIDLPGIIRHTESKEERHLVTIIEELVQQYIANENSIVIATIACKGKK